MISSFEGLGYGLLNDVLGVMRSEDGYAQPNRYEIEIGLPSILRGGKSGNPNSLTAAFTSLLPSAISGLGQGGNAGGLRNVQLRAAQVTLPGRNIETTDDVNVYGPVRRVASGVNYAEDLNIQFQASSGLDERIFFEQWQQKCFNPETWNVGYYADYVGSADVYLLDINNQRRFGLKINEMWPKTIAGTDLSGVAATDIIKNEITFAFRTWTTLDADNTPPSIADKIATTVVNSVERNITANIPAVLRKL